MKRSKSGQSMVEYALGIGCIAALCMISLGATGHLCGHMIWNITSATNASTTPGHPGDLMKDGASPWNLQ
ncbi:MAG: hypothetical protein K2X27_24290 [Candidatus Obscuribacterales bacterium]|nr:hypothetical protein [Candidatus Obscuribacterales bacterium]